MNLKDRYESALDFSAYLDEVEASREMWHALYRRARVPDDLASMGRRLDGPWYLLALSEDWCGDAVNVLPLVARWAETVPGLELRVLSRDENPDLMDAHLTNGRSRSIPVIMVLDRDFREVGWWGPRPSELQEWVLDEGLRMNSSDRYREIRRWYARDRGRTVLRELLEIMAPSLVGSR